MFAAPPGLYVHIPFCRPICPFCPYNKVPYVPGVAARYVSALGREASREVLPPHMTREGADRLKALGFSHVSLGVQSFDPRTTRRLRRPGTPKDSRAAVENALGVFDCVDVDLIFDTAHDDPQTLLDDPDRVADGHVDHAAVLPRPGRGRGVVHRQPFLVNHFGITQYHQALAEGRLPLARLVHLPRAPAAAYRTFWQAYTGTMPVQGDDPLLAHPVSAALRGLTRAAGWSRRAGDAVVLTQSGATVSTTKRSESPTAGSSRCGRR